MSCNRCAVTLWRFRFSLQLEPMGTNTRQELSSIPSTPVFNVAQTANSEPLDTALPCATQTRCETEGRQHTLSTSQFLLGDEISTTQATCSTLVDEQKDLEHEDLGDEDETTQWDLLARDRERKRLKKRRRTEKKRQAKQAPLNEEKKLEEVLARARVKFDITPVKPTAPLPTPQEQVIAARRERQDRSCKETVKKQSVNIGEFRDRLNCRSKPGNPPQILECPNINVAMHSLASAMLANKQQERPAISDAAP